MGTVTNISQHPKFEDAKGFEDKLRHHQESQGVIPTGEADEVAPTAAGEGVRLELWRNANVETLYKALQKRLSQADEASRRAMIANMGKDMGVKVNNELSDTTVDHSPDIDTGNEQLNQFIHDLAEKIYKAMSGVKDFHKRLALIKTESIGPKIVERLDNPGDVNILMKADDGERLRSSLLANGVEGDLIKNNDYGFVIENRELGFKTMFLYQEKLHNVEGSTAAEDVDQGVPKDEHRPDSAVTRTPNSSTPPGTSYKLAA